MKAILVVDDDAYVRQMIRDVLNAENYHASVAGNGKEALALLSDGTFDLVITDLIMPEMEGIETITRLRASNSRIPIIAISGGGKLGPADYLETARYSGADATLAKPFSRQELLDLVSGFLCR